MRTLGRLDKPDEFGNIVVKQTANAVVRLHDVARVELAAQNYASNSYLDDNPSVARRGVPAAGLERARHRRQYPQGDGATLAKNFPQGMQYTMIYDPTQFIRQSVDAVVRDHPRGDGAGGAGGGAVPADLARRGHPDLGDPDLARSALFS